MKNGLLILLLVSLIACSPQKPKEENWFLRDGQGQTVEVLLEDSFIPSSQYQEDLMVLSVGIRNYYKGDDVHILVFKGARCERLLYNYDVSKINYDVVYIGIPIFLPGEYQFSFVTVNENFYGLNLEDQRIYEQYAKSFECTHYDIKFTLPGDEEIGPFNEDQLSPNK